MTLSVEVNTDSIDVVDGDDESVVTLRRDDYGIVVHSEEKFKDSSTGESVVRYVPVDFVSYNRRKLQDREKFYEAVEQKITKYARQDTDEALHSMWSVSREARRQLKEQETEAEGDMG